MNVCSECLFFFSLFLEISRYTLSGLCKSSVGSRTSSLVARYKAGIEMFAVDNSIGNLNNSSQIQKACIFLHVMGGSCVYERADLRVTSVCWALVSYITAFVNSQPDLFYLGLIPQREREPKPEYYCSSNLRTVRRRCSHLTPSQRGLHVKISAEGKGRQTHTVQTRVCAHRCIHSGLLYAHTLAHWQRSSSGWYLLSSLCSRQISAIVKPVRQKCPSRWSR